MTRRSRLLIIEDEAAIRDGLIDVFVYHGFDVDSCGNGNAGLEKALTGAKNCVEGEGGPSFVRSVMPEFQ